MSGEVSLIEAHDGRVSVVGIRPYGEAVVVFSELAAFHEIGRERYEVRLHPARLLCHGVHGLTLQGELAKNDYVSDGQVLESSGASVRWEKLRGRRAVNLVQLQFGSGMELRIQCREAELSLEGEGQFLEVWEGPLQSRVSFGARTHRD